MKVSINSASNNANRPSLNKYGSAISVCQNQNLVSEKEPFASYLNFTGGINSLSVAKPSALDSLIRSLIDFKGDNFEFAQHAFDKMKIDFGYGDLMHDNFKFVDRCEGESFAAQFNPYTGGFEMDKSACKMLRKAEIAYSLRHEFEHFLQFNRMFRSEEIGVNNWVKADVSRKYKIAEGKGYIFGINIDAEAKQRRAYPDSYDYLDMDFWSGIIDSKGVLTKDSAEAKQAKEEFESLMKHKIYINTSELEKYNDDRFPKSQKTKYYDEHGIGEQDNYYRNPLEVGARKTENEFLDRYIELSQESYKPHWQIAKDQKRFDAIEDFMNLVSSKYGNNQLPDRFKAYIYDEITEGYLQKHPDEGLEVIDYLKEAARQIRAWSKSEDKDKLSEFKKLLDAGEIRLTSQEETDEFKKFAEDYLKS